MGDGSKFDLRNIPKKAASATAQKRVELGSLKSKKDRNDIKISGVIGNFLVVLSPRVRRMPLIVRLRWKSSLIGLGRPSSWCIILTMLRYCFIEENLCVLAKKATYR